MRNLVLIIVIVIAVTIFSTQNSQPVTVSVLVWQFQASLAIIVFLSLVCGVLIGIAASFLAKLSRKRKERERTGPDTGDQEVRDPLKTGKT
jgi:putative membrane protein